MRNHNRNVGARVLAAPSLPAIDEAPSLWMTDDLVDEISADPAFRSIAQAITCARYLDLDITDPGVIADVVAAGRKRHAESGAPAYVPRPLGRGIHEPVIYYMRVSEAVKIGTTTNIVTRHALLTRPTILAVERGGLDVEHDRHEFFGALHVQGEWFRYEDPLKGYIAAVDAAFRDDFGTDLTGWLNRLREDSPFRLIAAR